MAKLTMVTMAYPCTACVIIEGLLKESLEKVKAILPDTQTEVIVLGHPRELYDIEGVEVERLPILLLDGEQVSAGSFLTARQLAALIREREEA